MNDHTITLSMAITEPVQLQIDNETLQFHIIETPHHPVTMELKV